MLTVRVLGKVLAMELGFHAELAPFCRCPPLLVCVQDAFFKKLPSLLPSVPALVAQRKLLPMLANAIEFGGAPAVRLRQTRRHLAAG